MTFILLISLVSANVEILDPNNGAKIKRVEGDSIIFSVALDNYDGLECTYTHFNTPDIDVPFDCTDLVEIESNITYFGDHKFEVLIYDIFNNESVVKYFDNIEFEVLNTKVLEKEEPAINLDSVLCIGETCMWDDENFVTTIFFAGILIATIILIYTGDKK